MLYFPHGVALDRQGNLYFADRSNQRVRRVAPNGTIATVAGGSDVFGFSGDGGAATLAQLNFPWGVAVDDTGNLYIADTDNNRVREVAANGIISTLAGTGIAGSNGDNGPAAAAQLNSPRGLALDSAGNLYIAEALGNRIRKITPAGVITRVAGVDEAGFSGDGGLATSATLNGPTAVAVDRTGTIFIADTVNSRIRKISPAGIIDTLAQLPSPPNGVALDTAGNVLAAVNQRVLKVTPAGAISTIAGTASNQGADEGPATSVLFVGVRGLVVDSAGTVYAASSGTHKVMRLTSLVPAAMAITRGNGQSGTVGSRLNDALVVTVTAAGGLPVPGVTVTFALAAGSATLSANSVTTGADGTAGVSVTLGAAAGAVTITASVSGLPAVTFTLTATPGSGGTQARAAAVVGAGLSNPSVGQISANGLITIFGENFAPAGTLLSVGGADLVGGKLPTKFGGLCVEIAAQRAPVFVVTAGQINAQTPSGLSPGNATVQVILNCGGAGEVRSNALTVTVQAASPEFFYFTQRPDGRNPIAALDAVTGARVGPSGLIPGVTFTPAKPGEFLTLFATGFGSTNPAFGAGELPDRVGFVTAAVTVLLGDRSLDAGDVLYAGVAPGFAGLYQVNIRIPDSIPDGEVMVTIRIGNFTSPAGPTVSVRRN